MHFPRNICFLSYLLAARTGKYIEWDITTIHLLLHVSSKVLLANNLAVVTYSSFPTKRKQRKQIPRETKTLEVQQVNSFGMQG